MVGSAVSMHDTASDNIWVRACGVSGSWLKVHVWIVGWVCFAVCTYNASISVYTLVSAVPNEQQ